MSALPLFPHIFKFCVDILSPLFKRGSPGMMARHPYLDAFTILPKLYMYFASSYGYLKLPYAHVGAGRTFSGLLCEIRKVG